MKYLKACLLTLVLVTVSIALWSSGLSAWSTQTSNGPQPNSTIWHSGFMGLVLNILGVVVIWGGYELGVRAGIYRRLGWMQRFFERYFPENPSRGGSS